MKTLVFVIFSYFLLSTAVLAQESSITIDLEKNTTYVTRVGANEFLFSYSYQATQPTNLQLQVILPAESVIVDRGGLLVSRPFEISTDGRRISIFWDANLAAGEDFAAFVQYEGKSSEISTGYIIILILVIGAIGVFAGYRINIFKKERFISEVVSEDEKKVVEEIKKKGEILQEDLRHSLNWSKTKISKIVRNLEAKKVVIKIPYKKTNKLKLK